MSKKKLIKAASSVILLAALVPNAVSATTWTGGRSSAVFSAYYDSSIAMYGYTSHFDDGRANWNGISSKVSVSKASSNSSTADEYYAGTTENAGLLGKIQPYKKNFLGINVPASEDETWNYCVLSLYHNQITASTLGSNPPGLTRAEIVSTVTTHEIGHTLSLAHSPSGTVSVMTANEITDFAPNAYDNAELKSKWGN